MAVPLFWVYCLACLWRARQAQPFLGRNCSKTLSRSIKRRRTGICGRSFCKKAAYEGYLGIYKDCLAIYEGDSLPTVFCSMSCRITGCVMISARFWKKGCPLPILIICCACWKTVQPESGCYLCGTIWRCHSEIFPEITGIAVIDFKRTGTWKSERMAAG